METDKNLVQCPICGALQYGGVARRGELVRCCQCRSVIDRHYNDSVNRSLAFSVAALMLYMPANIYPVIKMELWGDVQENTIWSSIVALAESNMLGVAIIVFLASIVVPFIKILGMTALCLTFKSNAFKQYRTWLYKLIQNTGHWSMLDIFLVAVLIALLKIGSLAYAVPGPGLIYFTAMVACTMLASLSFDPKMIWDENA